VESFETNNGSKKDAEMSDKESAKGFLYGRFILIVLIAISVMLALLIFLDMQHNELENMDVADLTLILVWAGSCVLLGIVLIRSFPDTYHVELIDDKVRITSGKKTEEIPLKKIIRIEPISSILNSWLSIHEFYLIEFTGRTMFGKTICFKNKGKSIFESEQNFGEQLKTAWIIARLAGKDYSGVRRRR
jgi:uncharacterized membrane protein